MRKEGRATPALIHRRIDSEVSKQRINTVLTRLQSQGRVRKVCIGLYEVAPDKACADCIQLSLDELYRVEGGGRVEVRDSTGDVHLIELQPSDGPFGAADPVDSGQLSADFQRDDPGE